MSKLSRNAAKAAFASSLSPAKNDVHGLVFGKDAAEDRIERLDDVGLGGGGGDLLGHRVARGGHESGAVGVERVGDVDEDLAGQRVAVVRDRFDGAGVQDGHE